MDLMDIARQRLYQQRLCGAPFGSPEEAVATLGAVQAQDYAGARWALGQRLRGVTDADIEHAFETGVILRTHMLRPTWHFVTPADIRWILALTAPRVNQANAFMYRKLELDEAVFGVSNATIAATLQGGQQLTRGELAETFERAGIAAAGLRLGYLLMRAELDGLICSGPRRGKQFTYALLDERAPGGVALTGDDALAELARRYFATRGPATTRDFAMWSGLSVTEAKHGLELVKNHFESWSQDGLTYWFDASATPPLPGAPAFHLLPNYDEYFIGFADRRALAQRLGGIALEPSELLSHSIFIDGQMVGSWRRAAQRGAAVIEMRLHTPISEAEAAGLHEAAENYGAFLEMPVLRSNLSSVFDQR